MELLTDLFSTAHGLMGIGGIPFMSGMCAFFLRLFMGTMPHDPTRAHQ